MIDGVDDSALIIALCLTAINISIGFLVFFRNTTNSINRIFLAFTIFLSLWASSSAISDGTSSYQLAKVSAQLAYGFSVVGAALIWLFSEKLASKEWSSKKYILFGVIISFLSVAYGTEYVYHLKSLEEYTTGYLYIPYLLTMLTFIVLTAHNFISITRNGTITSKKQARIILYGLEVLIICALLTNAILPVFTNLNSDILTSIGPFFTIIFVSSSAFAILKHKLFDIRAVVVRSLGYVFSLVFIGVVALFALSFISNIMTEAGVSSGVQNFLYVLLTLLLALIYQPFKKRFDHLTRKLFYQDAYDTQDLLNEFNQVIVSTIELDKLLVGANNVIEKYLKPQFCNFAIRDRETGKFRLINIDFKAYDHASFEKTLKILDKSQSNIIVTDMVDDNDRAIQQELQNSDIALVAKIAGANVSDETIGYIILGFKKSGNIYNWQDSGAMQIIANELAIAIQNALQFEEIQQFNITLQQKVDDATRQLRRTNEKLKQLDQTKDDFISMASHQLRTPLTSVKGYISMVMEGDAGKLNKMQTKLLDQAFVSSQRMVYLIADLLNVSRLRTGKFVIEALPINLADVVEQEVEQLIETAESRGLTLSYEKPQDFPVLNLDETKIRQVMMNFIDNAIYYTKSGGKIVVSLSQTDKSITFTVQDDGIGVPKGEQPHLFNKFFRAGNAKKARPDGTGLGLFMAKKVIVAQGGSIVFKSTEGKGSTFGFTFDKRKLAINAPNGEKLSKK